MSLVLTAGIIIVNFALVAYSLSFINLVRKKSIGFTYLLFLTIGVLFDITSTVCMMIGSGKGIITIHGIIGYSALIAMITDMLISYRFSFKFGKNTSISSRIYIFSYLVYFYWVIAYLTGAIIVMKR